MILSGHQHIIYGPSPDLVPLHILWFLQLRLRY